MHERVESGAERSGDWHALCNGGRADTGREASGSRADGGRRSCWGSEVSRVRKRRVKVGHLHRHAAFRTSAAGLMDIPQDVAAQSSDGRTVRPGARTLVSSLESESNECSARSRGSQQRGGWTQHELAEVEVEVVT